MNDAPIKPIRPVHAVGPIREIGPRRRAALFQLRQWLDFVKRKNRGKRSRAPRSGDEPANLKGPLSFSDADHQKVAANAMATFNFILSSPWLFLDILARVPPRWDPVHRQGHAPTQESTALPVILDH